MTDLSPLDRAHAAMMKHPDDRRARIGFYASLSGAELFLLLNREAAHDTLDARIFPVDGADLALVFDTEARLAAFCDDGAPYAALSGRAVAQMLAGHGIGLGVNLGVAPSAIVIPAAALRWLSDTLSDRVTTARGMPREILPPHDVAEPILLALDAKLALAAGLARCAYLVGASYDDAPDGILLAFIDAIDGSEPALTQVVSQALIFSAPKTTHIDVVFFKSTNPICARLAKVGLRFDMPAVAAPPSGAAAPGLNPDKPPRLR
ncbi:MAG: SseB family protein [Paracoccaceae bacterium]